MDEGERKMEGREIDREISDGERERLVEEGEASKRDKRERDKEH